MPTRWLRLWFGFREPVDRRTYFTHGLGLTALKYGLDALLVWTAAGRVWTPFDYLNPLWSAREELLSFGPRWLVPAVVVLALPFLWIGVSMTMRRAADAGRTPWLALLFFVPVVNYGLMAALSLAPSRQGGTWPADTPASHAHDRLESAMLGVGAALAITAVTLAIGIMLRRSYSAGLFLGVPFTIGYISSYIYNRRAARAAGESVLIALSSVALAGGILVLFALEGLACTVMAFPIALAVAWPGAVLGRIVARRTGAIGADAGPGWGAGATLLMPLVLALEPRAAPPPREVLTVVDIVAPPELVWPRVVEFPAIAPPAELVFRAGIAAPIRARVEGTGVGAVRYCDFTTGSFVEPVTEWEERRLLAFDITEQATPLREWSPHPGIRPPHLDGYFRATRGEFRLVPLPGGGTRLEGRTAYVVDMFPQAYWGLAADHIVATIHERVMRHIKQLAEEDALR